MQGGDYEKESIETALDCYLPRAIYVTMMLVNRLDGLVLGMSERKLLQAILVSVFDDATSLWHWPEKDHRHLQLTLPSRFIEKNLWKSLDNVPKTWKFEGAPVPVSYWPQLPPHEGGICLYQRRLADQKALLEAEKPVAMASVFPRPNQAFWTLSALWSGWLWGRKGVTPMRSALSRRRYDWYWFAQAINASCKPFAAGLPAHTRVFGIFPQITANFYLGLQAGMRSAGFESIGAAYRIADDLIQCEWKLKPNKTNKLEYNLKSMISEFFNKHGEPANFLEIVPHCLTEIAMSNTLPLQLNSLSDSLFSQIQEEVTTILRDEKFAQTFKSSLPGGSKWWLCDSSTAQLPLSERVEIFIRNLLIKDEPVDIHDLELQVCGQFNGSDTPPAELIRLCIESYADPILKDTHRFLLQPEENLVNRKKDITEMRSILASCAKKMGVKQEVDTDSIVWQKPQNHILYRYFLSTSCEIAKFILSTSPDEDLKNVIVFPGSRSRLMDYRLKHDPRLEAAGDQNWVFAKFRTLRRLSQQDNLTLDVWKEILNSDPPLWDPPVQFQLF